MPLSIKPKLLSAADNNEKRSMCYKSNSSINMIGNHTDKTVQELFDSLLNKYQIVLDFIFHYISGIHYICKKITINHDGSYREILLNGSKVKRQH